MVENESQISDKLSGRRIFWAVFISIAISAYLLISGLLSTSFEKVAKGKTGQYEWVDDNGNGKVDHDDPKEFKQVESGGQYEKLTYKNAFKDIDWGWHTIMLIVVALLMMVIRDVAYMIRIRILTEKRLSWKSSVYVILIWEFASALSPGVVGGAGVAMFILNREKIPLGKSTAIVLITALMDNLFYIVVIPIVFIFISQAQLFPEGSETSQGIFWLGYTIIFTVCTILFLSIFVFPRLIKTIIVTIFRLPFLRKWKDNAIQTGDDVIITSRELSGQKPMFWLSAFGATILSWTARFLVINFILMIAIDVGIIDHFLIFGRQLVMWLIMLVSPTPGGSGVAEWAFSEFLGQFSISILVVYGLAFLWRMISYFPYLIIGPILFPRWLRKTR